MMTHHYFIEIAIVITIASLSAVFLSRFKQQPMVGYILAGVLIGPSVLGIVESEAEIKLLAETGVILLLFVLGMELPLQSFRKSYKVALPITLALVLLSLGMTFGIGFLFHLSLPEIVAYGFIVALSSTAVAVKLLEDVDPDRSELAQIIIGVLIVQDLIFIPMIILINALGMEGGVDLSIVPKILVAIILLIGLIVFLSKKDKVHLLFEKTVEKHKDLIPVAALTWCFVGAGLSEYVGLSPAYGAFIAGLIIGNSYSKDKVLPKIEPMQSVFLMIFFLSIGMLIDFKVISNNFALILLLLSGIMIFKTLTCIGLLKLFVGTKNWKRTFVSGLTISQVGEFSFILAATALSSGIFNDDSYKIIVAVIALSISISPLWLAMLRYPTKLKWIKRTS